MASAIACCQPTPVVVRLSALHGLNGAKGLLSSGPQASSLHTWTAFLHSPLPSRWVPNFGFHRHAVQPPGWWPGHLAMAPAVQQAHAPDFIERIKPRSFTAFFGCHPARQRSTRGSLQGGLVPGLGVRECWDTCRRYMPLVVCFSVQRGPRLKKGKSWKPDQRKAAGGKSKSLLQKLRGIEAPEQIYEELDAWSAWDLDFPIVPLKRALAQLKEEQEWTLILVVCRWMLSKGQGRTLGTFELMVTAHDAEGRWEDADRMWQGLLAENPTVIPRIIFSRMMDVYAARSLHQKCLEVFETMEDMGVRPHESMLECVVNAYRELGQPGMAEDVVRRYPPTPTEIKKRIRKPLEVDASEVEGRGVEGGKEEEGESERKDGRGDEKAKRVPKGGRKVKALEAIIQRQASSQVPDWYAKWLGTSADILEERVSTTYASTREREPGT